MGVWKDEPRNTEAFQGQRGALRVSACPLDHPPVWSQQTVDTFWLLSSFVQNELT